MPPPRKPGFAALFAALLSAALAWPSFAQDVEDLEIRQKATESEYSTLNRKLALSRDRVAALESEVSAIRKEKAVLTAALIQTAKTEKKLSEDIQDIEARLTGLKEQHTAIRISLKQRRNVLSEVLAALQRIGLNPPPALIVQPHDALASVRSAILLGAVVPEMRAETEILIADLKELKRVTNSIETERQNLAARVVEQLGEKKRLALLVEEKQQLETQSGETLHREQAMARKLATEAQSLQQLITSLESRITSIRDRVAAARQAEEERLKDARQRAKSSDPSEQLIGSLYAFVSLRGKVPLPATGHISRHFGETDDIGRKQLGDTVLTQSGAIVTAPADSTVLYAGPFRSYGQLLILDAKDGYHVVLAGIDRINVGLGQAVLAGEPVGVMGDFRVASNAATEEEHKLPELYVEFRRNGKPVDPAPWWAPDSRGRTGNDT